MKLEKLEGSENYCCTVVKLPPLQDVVGLDNLKKVTVFGNDVLVGKNSNPDVLYLFFPAECAINQEYLGLNNEFRESTLNTDRSKKGFFEPTGRVKAIKFKGVISSGYLAPLESLEEWYDTSKLKVGDDFNIIEGTVLCKKYKIVRMQPTGTKESRFNKKLKRFDKLVPNQFRFHESTSQLAKNLHQFNPEDIIVITDKWHGTSAVFSNVLIKKELSWRHKLIQWLGFELVDKKYDNLYSSRSVIKNQYINKDATKGYYNEDIWGIVNKELEDKVEPGISIFGEIVGYLPSGGFIQKDYDYGCQLQNMKSYIQELDHNGVVHLDGIRTRNEHKFLVYRMTYTKPDGSLIEYSWQQIKDYCKKYNLETVKELYFGKLFPVSKSDLFGTEAKIEDHGGRMEILFNALSEAYLEKDCKYCANKVPAEGICVRIDGRESYMTFKLKSKRFLEKETKDLDAGVIDMEEEQQLPVEI